MKKILIVIGAFLLLIVGGYGILKYALKDIKPVKPIHPLDDKELVNIRAAIISKLQKVIKDASHGLYALSIKQLGVDVLGQTVSAVDIRLDVDSTAYYKLEATQKLPDDIFKFSAKTLHVDGLGIDDLIHKNRLLVGNISMTDPVIESFHKNQPYNAGKRKAADTLSLYQQIMPGMQKIAIKSISVQHGSYINHIIKIKDKVRSFRDITVNIADVLIDSATQFTNDRFLFAKRAYFEMDHYELYTEDKSYIFNVKKIAITADQHKASIDSITLLPRGGKAGFESRLKTRKEMYEIRIANVSLDSVDWWSVINEDKFFAKRAILSNGYVKVYLDRRVPKDKTPMRKLDNFPQQELPGIPVPLSIQNTTINNMTAAYEEVNPDLNKSGTITFDGIKGNIKNVTNVQSEINKNTVAIFEGSAMFMKKSPMSARFQFYLSKARRGAFIADGRIKDLDHVTINSIAEPIGEVSLLSGNASLGVIHSEGDNFNIRTLVSANYSDLSIALLKTDSVGNRLRRKGLIDFAANTFFVKKNNPAGDKERKADIRRSRSDSPNFFNYLWTSVKAGLLKIAGVPDRFANL